MATVTKPMALDETLQGTNNTISTQNSKLDTMNTKLQAIVDAIGSSSLIGDTDISGIADGTITGAIAGLDSGKVDKTSLGANNGVAQLDSTGKVPSSQLPSFVDDVLEYASASAFPTTGESGKIYVALDTNLTYRWGGSAYVEISPSLALGEISSTAYRGDRGKIAYDHSQDANRVTTATAVGLYKVGATSEGHISGLTPIQKSDLTGLGLVGSVTDSTTNGNIMVDGVEIQAYDDTDVQNDIDEMQDELSTDYATVEGNPINFTTLSAQNSKSTILSLEPIQDLHGYSKPWVGGAGKNIVPLTLEYLKSKNTAGSWSGNTYSNNGVDYEILSDNDNNVIGVKVSRLLASSYNSEILLLGKYDAIVSNPIRYIVSGCPANGSHTTYFQRVAYYVDPSTTSSVFYDDLGGGNGFNCASDSGINLKIIIANNYSPNNLIFYPMICDANATNPAQFEPYENKASISGRTEIGILGCGKNLFDEIESGGFDDDGLNISTFTRVRSKNYISVVSGQSYAISALPTTSGKVAQVAISYYTKDDYVTPRENFTTWDNVLNKVITIPEGIKFIRLLLRYADNSNVTVDSFKEIQVEKNNQSTQYTAYQSSNDLTISLGQTVYGGTLDVENGVLVVDREMKVYDGTNYTPTDHYTGNIYVNIKNTAKYKASNEDLCMSCNCAKWVANDITTRGSYCYNGSQGAYFTKNSTFASASDFAAYALNNNIQMVIPLLTPITIQLTPNQISLLEGVNNISTDGDKITLTYRDGSVATLGDLTSAVDNLDSKIDETEEKIEKKPSSGTNYKIVECNEFLFIKLAEFADNSLPISLDDIYPGVTQFYDVISKQNVHVNFGLNGSITVSNQSDVVLNTYKLYGVCLLLGHINQ